MSIQRFEDILVALREHPEWLQELRALVLTEELLALPTRFARLEHDVGVLKEDVGVLKQDVGVLKQDVGVLKQDVGALTLGHERMDARQMSMEHKLDRLIGADVERRYREHGFGYLGRIAKRIRLLTQAELDDLLLDLEDRGVLSADEGYEVRVADAVYSARRDTQPVYMVLEASATVARDDVRRAASRAALLARSGTPTIAIVGGGAVPDQVGAAASEAGVWVVTNGTVTPPR